MPGRGYDDGGSGGGGSTAKTKTRAKQVNAREARSQAVLTDIVGAMQGALGDYIRRQMAVPGMAASVGQALPPPPPLPGGPMGNAPLPGVGPGSGGFFNGGPQQVPPGVFNGGPQPMGPGPWNGGFFNGGPQMIPEGAFNGGPQMIPQGPMGAGNPLDALLQLIMAMPQAPRR